MADSNHELLDYIKDSVDKLHDKVDSGFTAVDGRLKELEIAKAHATGYRTATGRMVSVVWGLLGGIVSSAISWVIYHKQ